MNDIIAKRTNDAYLIRCAQILNNKQYIQVHNVKQKDGTVKTFYFITAAGIEGQNGETVPFKDGFDTIVFVRNRKSVTMALLDTDFRIKMFADDDRCYYLTEKLGIEFRYENVFLADDNSIEKNYFELKCTNSATTVSYAINEDSIVEIIYYYEMKKDSDGDSVHNSIVNNALKSISDEEIVAHMKEMHEVYIANQPEEELGEQIDLRTLQEDETIPDNIRRMLEQAEQDREHDIEGRTSGEFDLGNSIVLSTASRKRGDDSNCLLPRVSDMYAELYTQAKLEMDDCFEVVDLFGNIIDTRDYELEERSDSDYEYDDDDEEQDDIEMHDSFDEDDCKRFDFYHKDASFDDEENADTSINKVDVSQEEKAHILSTITRYVVEKNFEFSDIHRLIKPMMDIFKEIEAEYQPKARVDKDFSDNE